MPRVLNKTKGSVVADEVRMADSLWSRFWGLMGRRSLPEGRALLLDPCYAIHTMFMRFSIDVIFLDEENRVVKVSPHVKPFRTAVGRGARRALEIAAGSAARAGVEEGDLLIIADDGSLSEPA